MKIFEIVQKQYAIMGISSSNQMTRKLPFNKRIVFGFLLFGCLILSQFVYIYVVVNGFIEYVECICSFISSVIMFVSFAATVFGETTIFECIDNLEILIDTSKTQVARLFIHFIDE